MVSLIDPFLPEPSIVRIDANKGRLHSVGPNESDHNSICSTGIGGKARNVQTSLKGERRAVHEQGFSAASKRLPDHGKKLPHLVRLLEDLKCSK